MSYDYLMMSTMMYCYKSSLKNTIGNHCKRCAIPQPVRKIGHMIKKDYFN